MKQKTRGTSLMEIMVAVGILGGLSLTVARLVEMGTKSNKRTETSMDVYSIKNRIDQILLDKDACVATFTPIGITTAAGQNNAVTNVKNRAGNTIIKSGLPPPAGVGMGGTNNVYIESMFLRNTPAITTSSFNTFYFGYTLKTIGSASLTGTPMSITKFTEIQAYVNTSTRISDCYSAEGNAVNSAKKEFCEILGGTPGSTGSNVDSCNLSTPIVPNGSKIASTQWNENRYVNVAGDTMTGDLAVPAVTANTISGTNFCPGGNCKTSWATGACSANNMFYNDINAQGTPVCRSAPGLPINCSAGQFINTINTQGTPTCAQPSPIPAFENVTPVACTSDKFTKDNKYGTCAQPNLRGASVSTGARVYRADWVGSIDTRGWGGWASHIQPNGVDLVDLYCGGSGFIGAIRYTCSSSNTLYHCYNGSINNATVVGTVGW